MWSRSAYASAPVGCPAAPFNPATLGLSLWIEGRDLPASGVNWQSRASAGSSGSVVTDWVGGSAGPQSLAHPPSVAPCGLDTAHFSSSPYSLLKIVQDSAYPIIDSVDGTIVAVFRYYAGRDFGFGPFYTSAVISELSSNWKLQMDPTGHAMVSAYTASGVQSAVTANAVSSGDWCIAEAQFTGTECRVRLNRGAWSSFATPRYVTGIGTIFLGCDGAFGTIVDCDVAAIMAANSVLSGATLASLEHYGEWLIGTTV